MLHFQKSRAAALLAALLVLETFLTVGAFGATTSVVTIATDATNGIASVATEGGQKLVEDSFGKLIAVYVDSSGRIGITFANGDPTLSSSWAAPIKSPAPNVAYARAAAVLVAPTSLRLIVEGGSGSGQINDIPVTILRDTSNNIAGVSYGSATLLDGSGGADYPTAVLAHNGDILAAWFRGSSSDARVKSFRWRPSVGWRSFSGSATSLDDVIVDSSNHNAIFPNIIERRDNSRVYVIGNRDESSSSTTIVFNKANFDGTNWSWGSQNLSYRTDAARGLTDATSLAWDAGRNLVIAAYDISGTTKYGSFTLDSSDTRTEIDTPSLQMTNNEWGAIAADENTGDYYVFTMDTAVGANNGRLGYTRRISGVWGSSLTIIDSDTNNVGDSIRRIGSTGSIDLLYSKSVTSNNSQLKFVRITISTSTKKPTSITISSTPNPSSDAQQVSITGRLADTSTGSGLSGRTVSMEQSLDEANWVLLGQTSTASDGSYQAGFSFAAGTHYVRSSFPGDSSYSSSTSPVLTQNVGGGSLQSYALVVADDGNVYKFQNGALTFISSPTTLPLRGVAWRPDGSYALIVGHGATLLKFDGTVFASIDTGVSTSINFQGVAWKPDGSYALIVGGSGTVLKYDGVSVTQVSSPSGSTIRSVSWHPSGSKALLVGDAGMMLVFQNDQLQTFSSGTSADLYAVAWNPNGLYAVVGGINGVMLKHDGASNTVIDTSGVYQPSHIIRSIAFPAAGRNALVVGDTGLAMTYDGTSLTRLLFNGSENLTTNNLYGVAYSGSNGTMVGGGGSLFTFDGSSVQQLSSGTTSSLRGIAWRPVASGDTQAPTMPGNLQATALDGSHVQLSWQASTDNVGVTGYDVFRNGTKIATAAGSATGFMDNTAQPSTGYTYTVVAFDLAGNRSPAASASVTTPANASVTTLVFNPIDDAYIEADLSSTNFGNDPTVQVDNSPVKNFLLKFNLTGVTASRITSAKLRLFAVDPSDLGGNFYVTSSGWSESTVTWGNAPAAGTTLIASLGSVTSGLWYEVDVGPAVTGNGLLSFRVSSTSTNGADYSSSEGTQVLELVITMINNPPTLNAIGDKTVVEESSLSFTATASDPENDALTFSLGAGSPQGASITAGGVFSWTPTEAQGPGSYSVTVVVSDGSLTDSETISVTVNEVNKAPAVNVPGPQTTATGQTLTFTVTATDPDVPANILTLSTTGLVSGMSFNPSTGMFSFTPDSSQDGQTFTVSFTASDNGTPTLTDTKTVSITVMVDNPPVLAQIGNKTVDEGILLSFTASATDPDANQTISYSLVGAPAGASIDSVTGLFGWTPTEAQGPGSYTFDVRATDNLGVFDSETITVSVNEVNQAPTLGPVGDASVNEEKTLMISLPVSDPDLPAQTLTYALSGNATGASVDSGTGVFTWTPTEAQGPGTYLVTITVTDSYGVSSSPQSFQVTVNDVNKPPVLTATGPRTVDENTLLTLTVTAADPDIPANNVGTISASGLPAGATFDPATGVFSWTPSEAQGPGSYTFSFSATDDGSPPLTGSASVTVTVNEVNTAPVLNPIGNKTVAARSTLTFTVTAADSDLPGQTLTYSLGSGAPRGAKIDPVTGVFTWKPTRNQVGTYSLTIIVSDGSLTDSETITITVT